ncbi:MAG TPA: vWA domain-containing protein [Solirubrobacteraceae bacterium]|nr:vWA domain-containing protein [Solirubrobacteraceae bacterium]
MTLLTPLGALAALVLLLPLGAAAHGRTRVAAVARRLGLDPPRRWSLGARSAAVVAAVALLGLAAAQPALTDESHVRERTDVAALFVLDTSRSMAASRTPTSPTRLARAITAAVQLRAAIPEVPAGVATFTDRVLPDLLPVVDVAGFDAVARRAVTIEDPPPSAQTLRATSYAALDSIATGNYFESGVTRRVIVLLTDGESNPFDPNAVASQLGVREGYRFVTIRFWNQSEAVFDSNGRPEPAYRPDPTGRVLLAELASALGGRSFEENEAQAATSYLRDVVGTGRTGTALRVFGQEALAPYVAGLALVVLLFATLPPDLLRRRRFVPWR